MPSPVILQGDTITETKTSEETSQGNTLKESVTTTKCTWRVELNGLGEDSIQGFSIREEGNLFVLTFF
jgi:hypothetical protein